MRLKDENSKKTGDKSNLELFTKLFILEIALFNMTAVAWVIFNSVTQVYQARNLSFYVKPPTQRKNPWTKT